jgi:hypothetical protein
MFRNHVYTHIVSRKNSWKKILANKSLARILRVGKGETDMK